MSNLRKISLVGLNLLISAVLSGPALAQTPPTPAPLPQNPGQWRHSSPAPSSDPSTPAQPGRAGRAQRPQGKFKQKLAQLNLTPDQSKQIQVMVQGNRAQMQGASPDQRKQARRNLLNNILGVLTPQQRAQLRSMRQGKGGGRGRQPRQNQQQTTDQVG